MKFSTHNLGKELCAQLRSASSASIAVAYFNPDDKTLHALRRVRHLALVVSDEFQLNNPYKLKRLNRKNAKLRQILSGENESKLHSKVFLIHRQDGTRWAMVGSANLTWKGLFSNQEACVILDSRHQTDVSQLNAIEAWFEGVLNEACEIDFDLAKGIFDAQAIYRLELTEPVSANKQSVQSTRCWALKTTEGAYGKSYWTHFLAENVIAIGWPGLDIDPLSVSENDLQEAVHRVYPDQDEVRVASKIKMFIDLRNGDNGDKVLICRGYPPNSRVDVHIYGIARVVGPCTNDVSSWWWLKHRAVIQVIDQNIPHQIIANALKKGSLMETIHEIEPQRFVALEKALRDHLGIAVTV